MTSNIEECVHYEFQNLLKCLDCNGFGQLSRRNTCKDYESKKEYFEDYINGDQDEN